MKVFFYTFGCKVNSCETEFMAAVFGDKGFSRTDSGTEADVIVVNSCTVTAAADRKARAFLRQAKRHNPRAAVVLTGCLPQASPEAASLLGEADIVTGNTDRGGVAALVLEYFEKKERIVRVCPHGGEETFERLDTVSMRGHTRAFLKIEDGCDRFCAYCAVPLARGSVRSLSLNGISEQAAAFAADGYKELVLTGVNLSAYGKDTGHSLADAVNAVSDIPGIERVRLSSLEPDLIDESIIKRLSECKKLCGHFHLSLQSGSDKTLAAMRRRYSAKDFLNAADKLRSEFNDASFTTDIMVGFPSETDEDFEESLRFVTQFGFLKCHVFPYSARPGTAAANMPQVAPMVKETRAKKMSAAAAEMRKRILIGQVGKTVSVIAERAGKTGEYEGYSEHYVPVLLDGAGVRRGDLVKAFITGVSGGKCRASVI